MTENNFSNQLSKAANGATRLRNSDQNSPWDKFITTLDFNDKLTEQEAMVLFSKTLAVAKSDWKDSNDNTLLMHMASRGQTAIVKRLIHELYADVNAVNKYGMTALHMAARGGFKDICSELLDTGKLALAGKKNENGDTAAMMARNHGHTEVADMIALKETSVYVWSRWNKVSLDL